VFLENISFQERWTEFFIYFVLSAAAIFFVFSGAITIPFYHHDIYKFSMGGVNQACNMDQGFSFIVTLGRPIAAYLDCVNNKFGNTLQGVAWIRIVCVLVTALGMSWFALWLRHLKISFMIAFLIAGSIFFLPAIQTVMIMIATSMLAALLFAMASHYFISLGGWSTLRNTTISLLGLGLLFLALLTYPALTAFFLIPALLKILFCPLSEWLATRKTIVRDVLVYCFCCVIYFGFAKELQQHRDLFNGVPSAYQFKLNLHFLTRITSLYQVRALLWNIYVNAKLSIFINLVIVAGCFAALRNFLKENGKISSLLQAILATLLLIVSMSAIYLTAPEEILATRVIFAFQVVVILLLFWSLLNISSLFVRQKEKILLYSAAILFFTGAYLANNIVTMSALNDYTELNFITNNIRTRLAQNKLPPKRIHIIASHQINETGMQYRAGDDIFNINSTYFASDSANIVYAALLQLAPRGTYAVTDCVFTQADTAAQLANEMKCINTTQAKSIPVTNSKAGELFQLSPDTFIINMNS
jgi:hypothetical protein